MIDGGNAVCLRTSAMLLFVIKGFAHAHCNLTQSPKATLTRVRNVIY